MALPVCTAPFTPLPEGTEDAQALLTVMLTHPHSASCLMRLIAQGSGRDGVCIGKKIHQNPSSSQGTAQDAGRVTALHTTVLSWGFVAWY